MTDSSPIIQDAPERPPLIMPAAEAAHLRHVYDNASVILEYGAGGSTAMASEMPGKTVFSVESDADWIASLNRWFAVAPPRADLRLHHGNIGPTRPWGYPQRDASFRRWVDYPNSVWSRDDFLHPDAVLVDGRFRAACFASVAVRINRPTVVLFDDYTDRPVYKEVECLARPVSIIGRMARFELVPMAFPSDRLDWLVGLHLKPF